MKYSRGIKNGTVAGYYSIGALILLLLTLAGWPWTAVLAWPTLILAVVSVGYLGLGSVIYGKRNGCLHRMVRIVYAPILLGEELSRLYYRKTCAPFDQITLHLFIGRILNENEASQLIESGVTSVVDLTAEFNEQAMLRNLDYYNLPLLDLTAPTIAELQCAVSYVESRIAESNVVYIHCKTGYSRTAVIASAYLMKSGICSSVQEAVALLCSKRKGMIIRPESMQALEEFYQALQAPNVDF